jgi:hypothetical protein
MKHFGFRDRLRAFGIHLGLSGLVLLGVFAIIVVFWYPPPYMRLQGALRIVAVMTAVHLLIGPLLTFLIYRKGKKGLRFDLSVIVLLQVAALAYGVQAIYHERPHFLVFAVDRFNVLAAADVDMQAVQQAGFRDKPLRGPRQLMAYMPLGEEFQRFQDSVIFGGQPDLDRRPEYWAEYPQPALPVQAAARPLDELAAARPGQLATLEQAVARTGLAWEQLAFVPVMGKADDYAALLETGNHQLVGFAALDPWVND